MLEVATIGLYEGLPIIGPRSRFAPAGGAPRGWDNVHWWGTRGAGAAMISAPGGFHAAHVHWRWGGAGSAIRGTIPEIDTSGVPASVPAYSWGAGGTRVLVDPKVWPQTLRVAVVKNQASLNPATSGVTLDRLSRDDWSTLFTSLRASPMDIEGGDDIVFWYSTEVHRETTLPADWHYAIFPTMIRPARTYPSGQTGTVFVHGIFFAHNAERTGFGIGTTGPEHRPNSAASIRASHRWYRTA